MLGAVPRILFSSRYMAYQADLRQVQSQLHPRSQEQCTAREPQGAPEENVEVISEGRIQ